MTMLPSVASSSTVRMPVVEENEALIAMLKSPSKDSSPSIGFSDSPLDRLEATLQTSLNCAPDFLICFAKSDMFSRPGDRRWLGHQRAVTFYRPHSRYRPPRVALRIGID